jgi:DNA-binding NtrC family response regulator
MTSVLYFGCPASDRPEVERLLTSADLSVVWTDTVATALNQLQRQDAPLLVDLSRGAAALQAARELRAQRANALIFAVVDARRPDLTTEAVLAGVADVFARPLSGRRVATAIARELRTDALPPGRAAEPASEDLYHHSSAMREVMTLVARAATMHAGVLVRGEDGTGRQVVARAIHAQGADCGPFVTVDCAAHDAEELESALFGSVARGTRPDPATRGLERISRSASLHAAVGGTLYLQNILDASTRVQSRLARILRDREAVLVDTGATIGLEVRPMAGVDPGFENAVREGRIRDDLFRRLSVMCIDMPPLRNRREDIPALANYFVRQICATLRVPPKTLSRPALLLLAALPWRGNAIELRRLIETVVTGLAGGRNIALEDVLAHVRLDGGAVVSSNGGTLRQARARFEREYIAAVLDQHHDRISEAAKALGIQRTNLYRKMRTLRLTRGRRRP